jgi:TolB protein
LRALSIGLLACLGLGVLTLWRQIAAASEGDGFHQLAAPGPLTMASPSATTPDASPTPEGQEAAAASAVDEVIYFEARSDGRSHLWAFVPGDVSALRLTSGDWDDRQPAVSPDGTRLAFASNRSGVWDLYIMDLTTGEVRALTETPSYEGHPTWSPDGMWVACEGYGSGELDLWILSVSGTQAPIQLNHPGYLDRSPAWDPSGRRIAFASEGATSTDIFFANLDDPDNRFVNVTQSAGIDEDAPSFSPDGKQLAYAATEDGMERVMVLAVDDGGARPSDVGQGEHPAWSPDGSLILALAHSPNESETVLYRMQGDDPLPGLRLERRVASVSWMGASSRPTSAEGESVTPTADTAPANGQANLVGLTGVSAPRAMLSERAAPAFVALRERTVAETGWDFLSSLDQAIVGLNEPLPPGFSSEDWLYTGRAFAFNTNAMQAGWVEVVPDEVAGRMYWRVFVRTLMQDGRRGMPLRQRPWDFSARYAGDPAIYDAGGARKSNVPQGYYIDFTELALDYGFERLPAMANWRSFYPGALFNEFARRDGLSWRDAVLELYPPEAIVTPTPFRTPTATPSRTPWPTATPWWMRWRTPTPRPSATPAGPA